MKKQNALWIILNLIFPIVFNVVFFVLGGAEHNVSVWLSYGFIHFAYLMLLLTPKLIRTGKSSAVFTFSIYSISLAYFFAAFITGVIFILVSTEGHRAAFLVQFCLAGTYGAILILNKIANERTADAEEKRQYQIDYVKTASVKLKNLLDKVSDKDAKKSIERVYDALYSSPVKSHPSLGQLENRILSSINELSHAISAGNKEHITSLADSLLAAINERNSQL